MMLRSFGASPTESCNLLSLLPVGVGDDLGLDRLRLLWRRSGRGGGPQRRGLGPRPPPALEHQEQSEDNHHDQGAVEKGLDWFLVVNTAVLLLLRATQFFPAGAVAHNARFLLQQAAPAWNHLSTPSQVDGVGRPTLIYTRGKLLRVPRVSGDGADRCAGLSHEHELCFYIILTKDLVWPDAWLDPK